MSTHGQVEEPGRTIVGPRPGSGAAGRLSVPQGIERLLVLAGGSADWRTKVLTGPLAAADEARIELSASERVILRAISPTALEGMIASFARSRGRPVLGAAAAGVAAAALLATGQFGGNSEAAAAEIGHWPVGASERLALLGTRPDLPPEGLLRYSRTVFLLKVKPADEKGLAVAEVKRALKGRAPDGNLIIDTSRTPLAEHAKSAREMIAANGDGPVLLFIGGDEKGGTIGKLHVGGKWLSLTPGKAAETWELDCFDEEMMSTWMGGTDMLMRLLDVLAQDPDAGAPSRIESAWQDPVKIGKIDGRVRAAAAVDMAGRGEFALFVAADGGDRIFLRDRRANKYEDATARLGLASKSGFAAWGDFDGDGRLDLASSDGRGLVIWSQGADGTFSSAKVTDVPKEACTGLAVIDAGQGGRAGLVWGAAGGAALLVPERSKPGTFAIKRLAVAPAALTDATGAGAPLVADFDGDGLPDVILPHAKGSVFFRGKGGGEFAEGVACDVKLGSGRATAFVGDFDMDGRLDILTGSEESLMLWQNEGGGRFKEVAKLSGEMHYLASPGAIGGNVCDINGDGRPDIFLAYQDGRPLVFFNRGFRSLMHAHSPTDLAESDKLPEAMDGQRAGVLADFDGDGRQDMALVLPDGTVRVLTQAPREGARRLALRVALSPGSATAGPITVSATCGRMPMGAWLVAPGTAEAFFAREEPGEIEVTWQLPGARPQKKTFVLDLGKELLRYEIETEGKK